MWIAALLLGVVLGAVGTWLVLRGRVSAEQARTEAAREAHSELENAFKALASEALRQNNASFLELARTQLEGFQNAAREDLDRRRHAVEELVAPIKESLEKVGNEVKTIEQSRRQDYGRLSEQLRSLASTTGTLATALRGSEVRGAWGEMQLRRAVEAAGMLEHCDFVTQETVHTDGGRLRPDLVVKLPGGRSVVVDAKAPLRALLDAEATEDPAERDARLQDYVRHVRDHVAKLSQKAYWEQFAPAPDFVLMYLPGESFYRRALELDPSLLDGGPGRRVILASPTVLITLLRGVAAAWREEAVAENARLVSKLGRELYERLAVMTEHFVKLGSHLDRAVATYNQTAGSFERRVLVSARRFTEYGVDAGRELPPAEPIERSSQPPQTVELTARNGTPELPATVDAA